MSEQAFKVGDRVRCVRAGTTWFDAVGTVVETDTSSRPVRFAHNGSRGSFWGRADDFVLVAPVLMAVPEPVAIPTRPAVPHYQGTSVECIDLLRAALTPEEFRGFLRGNALKHRYRAGQKGEAGPDMEKCEVYRRWLGEAP